MREPYNKKGRRILLINLEDPQDAESCYDICNPAFRLWVMQSFGFRMAKGLGWPLKASEKYS